MAHVRVFGDIILILATRRRSGGAPSAVVGANTMPCCAECSIVGAVGSTPIAGSIHRAVHHAGAPADDRQNGVDARRGDLAGTTAKAVGHRVIISTA